MSFEELPRMLRRRARHHLVVHQGRIWALGGLSREPVAECESYADEDGWRLEASLSAARSDISVVARGKEVWMLGGYGAGGQPSRAVDVLSGGELSSGPQLPVPLADLAVFFLHQGALAIAGGRTRGGPTSDCYWLDGDAWRRGPQLREARSGHAVVRVAELLWVIGGGASVEVLDGGRFEAAGALSGHRERLMLCPLPDGVWFGGGVDEQQRPCRDAWVLDAEGLREAEPLPEPLASAAASAGRRLLCGGMRSPVVASSAVREVGSGRVIDTLPVAVAHAAVADVDSQVVVTGGVIPAAGGVSNRCFRSEAPQAFPV